MSMRKQQRFAFAMRWLFLESRPLSSSVFYAVAVLQVTIMPKLILLQEGQTIPFELTVDETVIGRHPECTFQINSNMVSRKHAKVVKTADGYAIEDYAIGLARKWAIGQKDKDNGVLLIVAPNERKVRIEVGRRLEPMLTDTMAKLIIENAILKFFIYSSRDAFQRNIRV